MDEPRRPARRRNTTQDRLRALEERLAQLEPGPQAGEGPPARPGVLALGQDVLGRDLRTALEGLLGAVTLLRQSRIDADTCGHALAVERYCGSALAALDEALELATASGMAIEAALADQHPAAVPASSVPISTVQTPAVPEGLGATVRPKVLVAEDNEVNRRVAQKLLERMGADATCVEDGSAAVSTWAQGSFDLVLMDCEMPVLDGFGAAREIRKRERAAGGQRTPIVALTASCTTEDRLRCFEAGMDDFLAKPTPTPALLAKLQEWLPSLLPQS